MKIKTITRTLTLLYTVSGYFDYKITIEHLGQKILFESAIQMAGVKSTNNDIDPHENYIIEQSYLSLSWWLLNKGWSNLSSIIEALVVKNLKKSLQKQSYQLMSLSLI